MHTVRNRSAISRKAKVKGCLPKVQPPFLPPDARNGGAPAFPASVLVAPPRGAVIKAVPLPGAEAGPNEDPEALLILAERPARRNSAATGKTPRKAKKQKAKSRKAAPLRKKPAEKTGAAVMSPAPAALPPPPVLLPLAPTPLPPSRAVVKTGGGGMVQKIVRWLDAMGSALIGQPLSRKRSRVVLPKAKQALQRRPLAERTPTARQPIAANAEASDELRMLRLENDRLNRELQLLKSALRQGTPA